MKDVEDVEDVVMIGPASREVSFLSTSAGSFSTASWRPSPLCTIFGYVLTVSLTKLLFQDTFGNKASEVHDEDGVGLCSQSGSLVLLRPRRDDFETRGEARERWAYGAGSEGVRTSKG